MTCPFIYISKSNKWLLYPLLKSESNHFRTYVSMLLKGIFVCMHDCVLYICVYMYM
jgi:hypothetical protein